MGVDMQPPSLAVRVSAYPELGDKRPAGQEGRAIGGSAMAEPLDVVMNDKTHRFEVTLGDQVAFAEYALSPGAIALPHTVVPDAFAGRGVASALAKTALGYAREHALKVKPTCEFMAGYIAKHPEYHDLVHEDFRAKLGLSSS
jgi:predicted GNAT family acetyltransferase